MLVIPSHLANTGASAQVLITLKNCKASNFNKIFKCGKLCNSLNFGEIFCGEEERLEVEKDDRSCTINWKINVIKIREKIIKLYKFLKALLKPNFRQVNLHEDKHGQLNNNLNTAKVCCLEQSRGPKELVYVQND